MGITAVLLLIGGQLPFPNMIVLGRFHARFHQPSDSLSLSKF
jgi:hypothetical protein